MLRLQAAPVFGRREAGVLAKRRRERACLAEAQTEPDLRHRQVGCRQQALGLLDPAADQVAVRGKPNDCLNARAK